MSYRLKRAEIRRYAEELGIPAELAERIVVRRVRRRLDPRTGLYSIRADINGDLRTTIRQIDGARWFKRFLIRLDSDRPAYAVARTLTHELCHVLQACRVGPEDWNAHVRAELSRHGYDDAPHEREAKRFADERTGEVLRRCFA